jgi:putative Ca2+/H+ antiporter (TMEM165/GDT1 family)
MELFLSTFGLVFAAEMGDKTQLVAMAFAARYKWWKVALGILGAVSLLNLIAVTLGTYINSLISPNILKIAAAVIFLIFGLINLRNEGEDHEDSKLKLGAVATVALTFFIGELGDKTQLMSITLAARYSAPYAVFLGSTAGMLAADSIGIIVGSTVFKKIPKLLVKVISSGIFIIFGTVALYQSLPGDLVNITSILIYAVSIGALAYLILKGSLRKTGVMQRYRKS